MTSLRGCGGSARTSAKHLERVIMVRFCLALALLGAAGSAGAAVVNFVAGNEVDGPAFHRRGSSMGINDGSIFHQNWTELVDLVIDADGAGPMSPYTTRSSFAFSGELSNYQLTQSANQFTHIYSLSGSFRFTLGSQPGAAYTVEFNDAQFLTLSDAADRWGSTAQILSPAQGGPLQFLESHAQDLEVADFAFLLTNLAALPFTGSPDGRVWVNPNGETQNDWIADAAFSARVESVPAPSAAALLGVIALGSRRSRRRRQ